MPTPTDVGWCELVWAGLAALSPTSRREPMNQNNPYQPTPEQPPVQPHRGNLVLVLGILGIAFNVCGIPGILAWIFGASDLKQMKAGRMDPSGESTTRAGYLCGIIGTCMVLAGILLYLVIGILFAGAISSMNL